MGQTTALIDSESVAIGAGTGGTTTGNGDDRVDRCYAEQRDYQ